MSAPTMSEAGNANSRDTGVRGYSIDKFFDASTGEEGKKKKRWHGPRATRCELSRHAQHSGRARIAQFRRSSIVPKKSSLS